MSGEIAVAYVGLLPKPMSASSVNSAVTPGVTSAARTSGTRFGKVFAYSSMSPLKAIGGAALGLFAISKLKSFFGSAIDEARESQKVSALTAQVIKTTGGAAGVSAKQVGDLANAISRKVGIDDEAIQSGENLLLTFKGVRNEVGKGNDIFNQATQASVDLGAALAAASGGQINLKSATTLVGKALNDPIKGLSALARVGVTFNDGQKKQIETLIKGGKTMQAQKLILGELRSEFGGAAASQATAGEKFSVAYKNLQETIGLKLLPYIDKAERAGTKLINFLMTQVPAGFRAFKAAIEPVTSAIGDLISNHLEVFKTILAGLAGGVLASVIAVIGGGLVGVLGFLVSALASPILLIGALAGAAIYAYMKFASFREAVQGVIAWFQTSFVPGLMAAVAAVTAFALEFWARIQPLLPQVQAIFSQIVSAVRSYLTLAAAEVKIAVAVIQFVWSHFNGVMLDYAVRTFGNILTAIKGALNIIQGVIRLVTSLIKGDWSGAWDAIKQILKGAWQVIGAIVKQSVAQLQAVFGVIKVALPIIASKAWDLIKAAFVAGVKLAVKATEAMPGLAVAAIRKGIVLLVGVGKDLVQGLINGIKAQASAVISALGGIVDSAIDAAKKKLHIGSPSKLFHQFGSWTAEGFALGIVAGTPGVVAAATDMGTKAEKAILDKLTSMRDGVKGVLDGLKSDFSGLSSSVASNLTGDLFGFDKVHDFLLNLVKTKGSLKHLTAAFHKLVKWGVDPKFLSALFSNGGAGLILELASGSGPGARLDALTAASVFSDIGSLSGQLGNQVATADIGPKIDRTNKRLEQIEKAIKALPKHFGQEINKAVKHGQEKK